MSDEEQHARIKAALALRGITLSSIAKELRVAPTTVTIVSKGHRRSRRIETALAQAVGATPEQIWPNRYPNQKGV
jgi:Ner family transcriptional regulator